MIRRMKYSGVYRMSEWMARQMAEALERGPLAPPDALAAVPMHRARLRLRGYNQAQLLADHIGAACDIPVLDALTRTRNTKQQARLNAQARHKNLEGAFLADGRVRGLRVLLIDDVLTTGSTATHCARALYKAGAADVQLLTFAAAD
jgi:ComF family protein